MFNMLFAYDPGLKLLIVEGGSMCICDCYHRSSTTHAYNLSIGQARMHVPLFGGVSYNVSFYQYLSDSSKTSTVWNNKFH